MTRTKNGFVAGSSDEFLADIGAAPQTFRFRMPLPPNLANARMHHMVKHRAKVEYWRHLDLLLAGGILPPPPAAPLKKATITATMTLHNPMDDGNAANRAEKWPCDWLKTRGYIVDDSRKHLRWTGFPEQRITRKNAPCLEIVLEAA